MAGGILSRRGSILKTNDRRAVLAGATLQTVPSDPYINMVGPGSPTHGVAAEKIGFTTGWTYGSINGTCVDATVGGFNYAGESSKLICAATATFISEEGDSGSPVFYWDGDKGGVFFGILHGRFGNSAIFSTMGGLGGDLGSLNVTSEITVGIPNPSGSLSGGIPGLSWSAVSTTNTSATTIYKVYRWVWDAATQSWSEQQNVVSSSSSTSFTDSGVPITISAYNGASQPDSCTYSFVFYYVRAYNAGIFNDSGLLYFRGNANGVPPCV
ncbi:MAG TPA: hypothetical protein VIP11_17190 [Gemmatimonadaceae bacterium]